MGRFATGERTYATRASNLNLKELRVGRACGAAPLPLRRFAVSSHRSAPRSAPRPVPCTPSHLPPFGSPGAPGALQAILTAFPQTRSAHHWSELCSSIHPCRDPKSIHILPLAELVWTFRKMIHDGHPSNRECASQVTALPATLVVVSHTPECHRLMQVWIPCSIVR
jgi:hypothetical protein